MRNLTLAEILYFHTLLDYFVLKISLDLIQSVVALWTTSFWPMAEPKIERRSHRRSQSLGTCVALRNYSPKSRTATSLHTAYIYKLTNS